MAGIDDYDLEETFEASVKVFLTLYGVNEVPVAKDKLYFITKKNRK